MSDDLTWLEFRCETLKVENEELRSKIAVLKAERDALRALLRYWLPDETMIPTGHEAKWNESVAAIGDAREGK